jgi:hypothetical protein
VPAGSRTRSPPRHLQVVGVALKKFGGRYSRPVPGKEGRTATQNPPAQNLNTLNFEYLPQNLLHLFVSGPIEIDPAAR